MKEGIHIKQALGAKFAGMRLKIGVFNDSDVAMYAAVQEFGSPRKNIPRRSFLLDPIKQNLPELTKKAKSLSDLGVMLAGKCQEEIETQGHGQWQGFSENYKKRPSGAAITEQSKLLQDTGLLVKSITYKAEGA
jgi:hypothetical protein